MYSHNWTLPIYELMNKLQGVAWLLPNFKKL